MLRKSTFKVALLFVSACLLMLALVFPNASNAASNDQFLQGSWSLLIEEFPGFGNPCQYTANLVGSGDTGTVLCQFAYVPIPTEEQLFILDNKTIGTWERIGNSEFKFRMERVVNNEDFVQLPNLKFVDWGTIQLNGDTWAGTVQGALMDLEGNIIIPLPPLTLTATRITADPPASN